MNPFHLGLRVAGILAVLTIAEYIFAINVGNDQVRFFGLAAAAVAKTGLIVWFFMHIKRIWSAAEHAAAEAHHLPEGTH